MPTTMLTFRRLTVLAMAGLLALALAVPAAPAAAKPPPEAGRGLVERTLRRMSVEEKVGQLFWTRAYGASAHDRSYAANNRADYGVDTAAEVVRKYHLGGVLYFAWAGNTSHPDQMVELSNGLQQVATGTRSGVPLSLSIDQEGGIVQRLLEPGTVFPGNMALGATRSSELAGEQFGIFGEELRAVGVNTNFAPVMDVNTNPANPVIGVRSFGERAELVGELGAAATRELQANDVAATLKHFPGHGDTEVDSHYGLPIVTYDRQTLEDVHLAPFRTAIASAKPDAIMTAHIVVEAIDPENPATLSKPVLTGLLREDMGYEGLIVTDSLGMAGVREKYGDDRVPVRALLAGADVLLNPPDMDAAWQGMLDAVASGEISRKRLDASVRRVLQWKLDRGIWADPMA
ncbi:MAG: glycoside hydrolase family 3 protein, partial [Egibacteraceae bacterium]